MKEIGHTSEVEFIKAFPEFKLVSDLDKQYQDIDAITENGITVSIKSQETSMRTGNFSFEVTLLDTRTQQKRPGNFHECKADYYAIWSGTNWYLFRTSDIHFYVINYGKKKTWLNEYRAEDNRKQGRKYDQAESILIKVSELEHLAMIII